MVKAANRFTGRGHFDDVTQQEIGLSVSLLDLFELVAQTQGVSLELQVGVLTAGDLVEVDVGIARLHGHGALERCVQRPRLFPVGRVSADFIQ